MARILIVDDERAVSAAIKLVLEHGGHEVTAAQDGRKGLELLGAHSFDLLIVDIFMPGMDGFETMKLVRREQPALPIIVISGGMARNDAADAPDFLGMAERLGAVSSLQKPFRPRELLAAVAASLAAATPDADATRRRAPSD